MDYVVVYFAKGEPRTLEHCNVFFMEMQYRPYECSGLGNCRMQFFLFVAFCVIDLISLNYTYVYTC